LISYNQISLEEYESLKAENNDFKDLQDRFVLEQNKTFVGIFGIKDPIRDAVPPSIVKCNTAGITVRMVTGDNLETAKAIAWEAGILTKDDLDKDGNVKEFACMTGETFWDMCGGL
jgi:P-type E1-E2 ATPase